VAELESAGSEGGGRARGPGPLHASRRRGEGPRARRTARDAEARTRGGTRAVGRRRQNTSSASGREEAQSRRGAALDTTARSGLISLMRDRLLPVLDALLLALTARTGAAQSVLQLRWELERDVFQGASGLSRAAFTLTNRDVKPLPPSGWAI